MLKEDFHKTFAPTLIELVDKAKKSPDNSHLRKELKEACVVLIQKLTDYPSKMISRNALELVQAKGLNLQKLEWKDRLEFEKVEGKSAIVF